MITWYEEDGNGKYLNDEESFYLEVCNWFIDNKTSIRKCAENFSISYTKCWGILRHDIKYIDDDKYIQIRNICRQHRICC